MPLTDDDQTCLDFRLTTEPPARLVAEEQPGGTTHRFHLHGPHAEVRITAESRIETRRAHPFEGIHLAENDWAFYERNGVRQEFADLLAPTLLVPADPAAHRIAQTARRQASVGVASFLLALTRLLHRLRTYEPGPQHVPNALDDRRTDRVGIRQDFAHLMLAVCRSQGIPSRCVSGYVYAPPGAPTPYAEEAAHVWVECLLPGGLWRGFDPTHNLLANDRYVKVYWGRDYSEVMPARGLYRGPAEHTRTVAVEVKT